MAYECRVECDSVSPDGVRLTTFVCTYPRMIHSEVMTHRALSRNSASSRAIPVARRIAAVEADPFVPEEFGRNQKGMQARELLDPVAANDARCVWLQAADAAVYHARSLETLGVHKQLANRLLEPFAWHTAVLTATDWNNFFAQRCHPDAQPEFRRIAEMMRDAMAASTPENLQYGEWHLPFITPEDREGVFEGAWLPDAPRTQQEEWALCWGRLKLISAGRCARVSYETHDGSRNQDEDVRLAERLMAASPPHSSPFEHVATPAMPGEAVRGNFRAWRQFRHELPGESVPG